MEVVQTSWELAVKDVTLFQLQPFLFFSFIKISSDPSILSEFFLIQEHQRTNNLNTTTNQVFVCYLIPGRESSEKDP